MNTYNEMKRSNQILEEKYKSKKDSIFVSAVSQSVTWYAIETTLDSHQRSGSP